MKFRHLFVQDLKSNIKGEVLDDDASLGLYSTDASIYQIMPEVIVLPKDDEDVLQAHKIAKDHNVSILSRGGGTSLAGQTVGKSMILDFSKYMNKILEINEEEQWVRVQPGLVRDNLNEVLQPLGLHFAPDPATSSRATVGGMIGNNSSGTKSVLYGKTVDHIISLKIVLDDGKIMELNELSKNEWEEKGIGINRQTEIYRVVSKVIIENEQEIIDAFPKVMRRVQGYNLDEFAGKEKWNLAKLICGSEGTLATILEAKINLTALPKVKMLSAMHFSSLGEAIRAVNPLLKFNPSAIEILDKTVIEFSRKNLTTKRHAHFVDGNPEAILVTEFYGEDEFEVKERAKSSVEKLKALGLGYSYPIFKEGKNFDDVWMIRKKGLGLMLGMKGKKKPLPFIEDSGIPTDVLPEYIDRVTQLCADHDTKTAVYAHASVGVIHVRPILDLRKAEDIERLKKISEGTFKLVREYGGSWSGEHGDGLVRSYKLREFFGDKVYGLLREIKVLFDPENRMNPGKIIDAQDIDENLRYGTKYQDEEVQTVFGFAEDESFENAVHMCTGVGECRKLTMSTMCPSFKATRDEEHSTRGRANLLRLAMSGQLGEKGILEDRVLEALDLCLSCKACKSECPSNVDMAKLKSEVWQKKYDKKGIPLRDRFVKQSRAMAAGFSGTLAPVVNAIQRSWPFRFVLDKIVGIEKKRILPAYERTSFKRWFDKNYRFNGAQKEVVLFADTYLNYHESSIGKSALNVLSKLGYRVHLANVGCCQRPKISQGFLKSAKKGGRRTAENLRGYLEKGLKVVVCEPSCVSALNDDLPDLINDKVLAKKMKDGVVMIDKFLSNEWREDKIDLSTFETNDKSIHVHGHCHQKALYGTEAMKELLEAIKGVNVQEIPSGCCGMAGAFGYEKEHFELSEQIGREILFPAVEKIKADDIIVASGFSCRHQIEHFTGRKTKHWVEVFEEVLEGSR